MLEERSVDPYALEREPVGTETAAGPAPPVGDRFVGGRTVERLGRRDWIEAPPADLPPAESEQEPESEAGSEPSHERERSEPESQADGPHDEGRGQVYGRRRSRR